MVAVIQKICGVEVEKERRNGQMRGCCQVKQAKPYLFSAVHRF
jgi:hypothetical protein